VESTDDAEFPIFEGSNAHGGFDVSPSFGVARGLAVSPCKSRVAISRRPGNQIEVGRSERISSMIGRFIARLTINHVSMMVKVGCIDTPSLVLSSRSSFLSSSRRSTLNS
jgi:hypothetical protein